MDSEFSADLWELSRNHHVWICNSPLNTPNIKSVWEKQGSEYSDTRGVTSFDLTNDHLKDFYKWVGTIDQHHYGWESITVFGVELNMISKSETEQWAEAKIKFKDCGNYFKIEKIA